MATKDEKIAIHRFRVGDRYSRLEVAEVGGVSAPESIFSTNWSQGIVEFQNCVLLFVTLEKDEYTYRDYFERPLFWWQSQNRQTQQSNVIARMADGSLPTYLFARVFRKVANTTQPFVYCGGLAPPAMKGDNPVTCIFVAQDLVHEPNAYLAEIYQWHPETPLHPEEVERRKGAVKSLSTGQGRQLDATLRIELERYSMQVAIAHYEALGYQVEDTSRTSPFDLVCIKQTDITRVEVKGTVTDGKSVIVTAGEVAAAAEQLTELFVVSNIILAVGPAERRLSGGIVKVVSPWCPTDGGIRPTQFVYSLPSNLTKTEALVLE